jgi:hypothetical protein
VKVPLELRRQHYSLNSSAVTQIQRSFSLPIILNAELLTNLQLVLSDAGVKNVHRHVSPPSGRSGIGMEGITIQTPPMSETASSQPKNSVS